MEHDRVIEHLQSLLQELVDERLQITRGDNLFSLGLLDSVRLIEFVGRLEKTYGIAVEDREMTPDNFLSLERIQAYLQHKLGEAVC